MAVVGGASSGWGVAWATLALLLRLGWNQHTRPATTLLMFAVSRAGNSIPLLHEMHHHEQDSASTPANQSIPEAGDLVHTAGWSSTPGVVTVYTKHLARGGKSTQL